MRLRLPLVLVLPLLLAGCIERRPTDEELAEMVRRLEEAAPATHDPDAAGELPPQPPPSPLADNPDYHPSTFEVEDIDAPKITVSGTIDLPDGGGGLVDIDCFVTAPDAPGGRQVVNKAKVEAPGPYEMLVPVDFGELIIEAMLDRDADGPTPGDPFGAYPGNPLVVGDQDIAGVDLVLRTR